MTPTRKTCLAALLRVSRPINVFGTDAANDSFWEVAA